MKKRIAILLAALLLPGVIIGCKPQGETAGPGAAGVSAMAAAGRYTEREIKLPEPEGERGQYLIGLFRDGERICAIGCAAVGDDDSYQARYHRYSIAPDGTVTSAEERWLNECAPRGGNDLRVTGNDAGKLYFSFSDYDAQGKPAPHIFVSEDNGATGRELTGDIRSAFSTLTSMGVLDDGSMAVMDFYSGASALLDADGKQLASLDFQNSFLANCAARGVSIASVAPGGKAVRLMNRADGTSADFTYAFNEQYGALLAIAPDGAVYLADPTGLYRHAPNGTLWECLLEGGTCALGLPGFYPGMLYADAAGQYDTLYMSGNNSVYVYAFDASAAAVPEKELTVFSLTPNETVQQALVAFSRANSSVRVTYKVAMDGETAGTEQDYIKALNTELLAGTGPDILILDGLPLDSYIEKDVLLDLTAVVDGAEPMLENILGAAAADGRLYAVPTGFRAPLAIGGNGTEKAFADLDTLANAAEKAGDVPLLSNCAFSYDTLASYLLQYYGDALYAGGEANVRAFLENAKRISAATGCTNELGRGWSALQDMPQEELREFILGWIDMPQLVSCLDGKAQAVLSQPYGSVANTMEVCALADETHASIASAGGRFVPVGLTGINKAGKEQETAAAFVQTMLSYDAQGGNNFASQFPVNKRALTEMLAYENNGMSSGFNLDDGKEFTARWPTKARREQIGAILETLDMPVREDAALTDMLLPEITDCLSGMLTEAEAAGRILSLLSTYLSE